MGRFWKEEKKVDLGVKKNKMNEKNKKISFQLNKINSKDEKDLYNKLKNKIIIEKSKEKYQSYLKEISSVINKSNLSDEEKLNLSREIENIIYVKENNSALSFENAKYIIQNSKEKEKIKIQFEINSKNQDFIKYKNLKLIWQIKTFNKNNQTIWNQDYYIDCSFDKFSLLKLKELWIITDFFILDWNLNDFSDFISKVKNQVLNKSLDRFWFILDDDKNIKSLDELFEEIDDGLFIEKEINIFDEKTYIWKRIQKNETCESVIFLKENKCPVCWKETVILKSGINWLYQKCQSSVFESSLDKWVWCDYLVNLDSTTITESLINEISELDPSYSEIDNVIDWILTNEKYNDDYFEPWTYYVWDLCYIIDDWRTFIDLHINTEIWYFKGNKFWNKRTLYWDWTYELKSWFWMKSNWKSKYEISVDSWSIWIFPLNKITEWVLKRNVNFNKVWYVWDFKKGFKFLVDRHWTFVRDDWNSLLFSIATGDELDDY